MDATARMRARALLDATRAGDLAEVKRLVAQCERAVTPDGAVRIVGLEATDDIGDTPLGIAAGAGRADIVTFLIENGADIHAEYEDLPSYIMHDVPLCNASAGGHEEVMRILLAHGADVHARTRHGRDAPLALAVEHGHAGAAALLIAHGADPLARMTTARRGDMFYTAAVRGDRAMLQLLVRAAKRADAQATAAAVAEQAARLLRRVAGRTDVPYKRKYEAAAALLGEVYKD